MIGIELEEDKKSRIVVATVVEGSPASKSGILTGDVILEVNGIRFSTIEEVRDKLASAGTTVELLVHRDTAASDHRILIENKPPSISPYRSGPTQDASNFYLFLRPVSVVCGLFAFSYFAGYLRSGVKSMAVASDTTQATTAVVAGTSLKTTASAALFAAELIAAELAWAGTGALSAAVGSLTGAAVAFCRTIDRVAGRLPVREGAWGRWIVAVLLFSTPLLTAGAGASAFAALLLRPLLGAGFLASAATMAANGGVVLLSYSATLAFLGP